MLADIDALRGIMDVVPHPIFVKDTNHRFVVINKAMCDLMGHSYDAMIGKTDADFVPLAEAEIFMANDRHVLETGESNENEEYLSDPSGDLRRVITRKQRLQLADGTRFVVGCVTDITGFRRAEAVIRYNAEHDALTNLANRTLLRDTLQLAVAKEDSDGLKAGVLLIDLDGFKNVNDVFGHAAGDRLLIEVASILTSLTGPEDVVARLGGDEFAIVQRAPSQPTAAVALAEAIIDRMTKPLLLGNGQVHISASIGIADLTAGMADRETLLRRADLALYGAKKDGRNTWRIFEAGMEATHLLTKVLEDDLRLALDRNEFTLAYQPFVGMADMKARGFEALLRWKHPVHGDIEPSIFVPIAERIGLIAGLGEWVFRRACSEAMRWPESLRVAINLSPIQFAQAELPGLIGKVAEETGIDPRRIDLEVTEDAVMADMQRARRVFSVLHNLGVRIVLDDFGSGYSSIEILRALPFDKVKIDRGLVRRVGRESVSAAILSAILRLGHTLKLPVAVEGVETEDQLAILRAEPCDEVQGYLVGRPGAWSDYAPIFFAPDRRTA